MVISGVPIFRIFTVTCPRFNHQTPTYPELSSAPDMKHYRGFLSIYLKKLNVVIPHENPLTETGLETISKKN